MPKDEGLSRLTVDIPVALHRRLRVLAAQEGVEIRVLVTFALQRVFPSPSSFRQVDPDEMKRLVLAFPKSKKGGERR